MRTGRPREFDSEKALERAMRLFWKKGYEGTSLEDLTRVMGINRPSLYAAFGNKQELFRKAVERYSARQGPTQHLAQALNLPTARQSAEVWLLSSVDILTCPKNPRGCFLVQGALACGDDAAPIRKELVHRRRQAEAMLLERFERAVEAGDLPESSNAADLAKYIATVTSGLSVQASSGASREELLAVVKTAMRAWPP